MSSLSSRVCVPNENNEFTLTPPPTLGSQENREVGKVSSQTDENAGGPPHPLRRGPCGERMCKPNKEVEVDQLDAIFCIPGQAFAELPRLHVVAAATGTL